MPRAPDVLELRRWALDFSPSVLKRKIVRQWEALAPEFGKRVSPFMLERWRAGIFNISSSLQAWLRFGLGIPQTCCATEARDSWRSPIVADDRWSNVGNPSVALLTLVFLPTVTFPLSKRVRRKLEFL